MKASLIIAVYKNITFLKSILDSLKFQTEKDFEIIIAEDGEDSEMKNFISKYNFEQTFQHITQKDEGWRKNKCLNKAILASKTDWLIFIDGDCILHQRFIEMHLFLADEKSILAGKRVKLDDETSQFVLSSANNIAKLQNKLLIKMIFGKGKIKFIEEGLFISPFGILGLIPRIRKNDKLVGSNMSFSKSAIKAINGFDEDYILPAVGEDYDLTWRFELAGYKHVSVRSMAIQYHLHHIENWINQDENMEICRNKKNQNRFVCKNGLLKND